MIKFPPKTLYRCKTMQPVHFISKYKLGRFLQKYGLWKCRKHKIVEFILYDNNMFKGDIFITRVGRSFIILSKH